MKIARVKYKRKVYWARLRGDNAGLLTGDPFKKIRVSAKTISRKKVKLLPPVVPQKIILVGLNYRDHARELKMRIPSNPIIFLKPPTTIIGPEEEIVYPLGVQRLDYEGELAVVIGREARNISSQRAKNYIFGYTCINDVTARDIQKKDGQWTRAKSFDTFCPVGPWIETDLDPGNLRIRTYLNGSIRQDSTTRNLIFPIEELISFISRVMTLLPRDIISTGTPPGVGPMRKGDTVEIEIENIGTLRNYVK